MAMASLARSSARHFIAQTQHEQAYIWMVAICRQLWIHLEMLHIGALSNKFSNISCSLRSLQHVFFFFSFLQTKVFNWTSRIFENGWHSEIYVSKISN